MGVSPYRRIAARSFTMKLKFGSQPDRLLLREFPAFVVNRRTEQSFLYYDAADLSYTYEAESLG